MAKAKTATKANNGHVATNRIAKAAAVTREEVTVQPLNVQTIRFKLVGISPLMTQPMGEKARKEMLEKQMGKKKGGAREPRCPEAEFLDALYWVKGSPPQPTIIDGMPRLDEKLVAKAIREGVFGVPLAGFRNAMISACRNSKMRMTEASQCLFITGKHPTYAIIDGMPQMDNRIVRIGNGKKKTPMERFRPMFWPWSTEINVEFDRNMMSPDEVVNLLNIAGFYVGICEGRAERSSLGFGRWKIET
jgi:hypothetical protein